MIQLFPYLRAFKTSEASPDTLQYKIADCAEMRQAILREAFEGRL